MKKLLLCFAFICLLTPSQAQADLSLDFAVDFDKLYITPRLTLTSASGLSFGANVALGYDLAPKIDFPMRAEIEVAIRYSSDSAGNYKYSYIHIPVVVSVYYDFYLNNKFTPYLGPGVGIGYSSVSTKWSGTSSNIADTREGNFNFILLFTGGVSYALSDVLDIDVAYRLNYSGGIENQLLIGARYKF